MQIRLVGDVSIQNLLISGKFCALIIESTASKINKSIKNLCDQFRNFKIKQFGNRYENKTTKFEKVANKTLSNKVTIGQCL